MRQVRYNTCEPVFSTRINENDTQITTTQQLNPKTYRNFAGNGLSMISFTRGRRVSPHLSQEAHKRRRGLDFCEGTNPQKRLITWHCLTAEVEAASRGSFAQLPTDAVA
eukprot:2901046-Amphidinium_carterae.1